MTCNDDNASNACMRMQRLLCMCALCAIVVATLINEKVTEPMQPLGYLALQLVSSNAMQLQLQLDKPAPARGPWVSMSLRAEARKDIRLSETHIEESRQHETSGSQRPTSYDRLRQAICVCATGGGHTMTYDNICK